MKRILILNPYLPTLGGGEKYMGYLCLFLEKQYPDAIIDILVHNYLNIDIYDESYPAINELSERFQISLEKTNVRKVKLINQKNLISIYRNKAMICKITSEYDIFVNFMFLSKQIGKAKKNVYISMFPPERYGGPAQSFPLSLVKKYIDWKFYRSYDLFIPISDYSNQWLINYWGKSNMYRIVYPPVFRENDTLNNYDEAAKENIILSVGRFFIDGHNKKQLELARFFINNIEELHDYELHLVGGLSNNRPDIDYVDRIKKMIEDYPISVHTNAKNEDVVSLYKRAKVFWHAAGYEEDLEAEPYKAEHFGITTVEAMSYGVVPVVINKGGQPEIVSEEVDGYIWNDEAECIEKTMKLINNEQIRKEMASRAAEKSKSFSVETFYRRNEEIFNELQV